MRAEDYSPAYIRQTTKVLGKTITITKRITEKRGVSKWQNTKTLLLAVLTEC